MKYCFLITLQILKPSLSSFMCGYADVLMSVPNSYLHNCTFLSIILQPAPNEAQGSFPFVDVAVVPLQMFVIDPPVPHHLVAMVVPFMKLEFLEGIFEGFNYEGPPVG